MRPAAIKTWRAPARGERLLCAAVLGAVALVPLVSAVMVIRQGWQPTGDVALIGLRVRDILHGHPALIGQPTTGENFGSGIAGSHPGPIEFYLLAPFVGLLGASAGLPLGAAAINAASLAATLWLANRRGGVVLMLGTAAVLSLLLRSLGGNLVHDPVSSNVGTFPAVLALFAAWSVIAGDLRVAPLFVAAGSFALQDHLVYLGTVGPVVGLGFATGLWWVFWHRSRRGWPRVRRHVGAAAALGCLLWLPVVIDELAGEHNLQRTWRTFTGGHAAASTASGAGFGFQRVFVSIAPVPVFARRLPPLGYLTAARPVDVALALALLVVLVVFGAVTVARRRLDLIAPLAVAWAALLAGLLSAAELPVGAGIQPSNLRWMWTTGAFVWLVLAWVAWQFTAPYLRSRARPVLVVGLVVVVACGLGGTAASVRLRVDRDGWLMGHLPSLVRQVSVGAPPGRYVVRFSDQGAAGAVGPALVHRLDGSGYRLFVDAGPIDRAYGASRSFHGQRVDGVLVVVTGPTQPNAGDRRIAALPPLDPGPNDPLERIRVYRAGGP